MGGDQGMGKVQDGGNQAECDDAEDFCFSYYSVDPVNKSTITVSIQGKLLSFITFIP